MVLVKRECENKGSAEDCEWWKEQGYCATDSEFNSAMMDQCPCTCGEKTVHVPSRKHNLSFLHEVLHSVHESGHSIIFSPLAVVFYLKVLKHFLKTF